MADKSGPKKKIDKTKRYEELSGEHRVSADGSHVSIGGSTFKRTVLPSVAAKHVENEKLASDLEELDSQAFKETDTEAI